MTLTCAVDPDAWATANRLELGRGWLLWLVHTDATEPQSAVRLVEGMAYWYQGAPWFRSGDARGSLEGVRVVAGADMDAIASMLRSVGQDPATIGGSQSLGELAGVTDLPARIYGGVVCAMLAWHEGTPGSYPWPVWSPPPDWIAMLSPALAASMSWACPSRARAVVSDAWTLTGATAPRPGGGGWAPTWLRQAGRDIADAASSAARHLALVLALALGGAFVISRAIR